MTSSRPSREPVLDVDGLFVETHRAPLVRGVSLTIGRGERVGLIGESGSGKTLTALAVMGLLPPALTARGTVRLAGVGQLVGAGERQLSQVRGRHLAMVFQEPLTALNPTMRVGRQVAEVMRIHRTRPDRASANAAAVELLRDVRLPDPAQTARAYPHQLSGGQRQRVVLAMALANDPGLLVCDEPTTALDVTVQANVLDLVVRGVRARDAGLLFITHDLAVVATVCERVLVMHQGRIVESGPVQEVFTRPEDPYTRRLLAASELSNGYRPARSPAPVAPPHRPTPSAVPASFPEPATRAETGLRAEVAPGTASPPPAVAGSAAVELDTVSRHYRRSRGLLLARPATVRALDGVSLVVPRGERLGIVGESGCGKTTLLHLVAGLDAPTLGRVHVAGSDITGLPDRRLGFLRRQVQLVFQDPMGSLDPRMTVADSVAEPLHARSGAERRDRVEELLTSVGLDPAAAERYPHEFSGGERQRISIARALAPDPAILLADEPVSALDVSVRAQVLDLIGRLVDNLGLTLLFVSHDLAVVRHLCERVVVMKAGRIVEEGPTERVYNHPQEPYTRRLVASIPTLARALAGTTAADLAAARREEHP